MQTPDIKTQKQTLRKQFLTTLKSLTETQKQTANTSLCQQITTHLKANPHIKTITSFANLPFEPDLSQLHSLNPHITILYPHATPQGDMTFHHIHDPSEMPLGYYNLRQPIPTPETIITPELIDLVLTPAYAFTPTGQRLGKGGGYYDRFLTTLPETTQIIGIAYQCQILPNLPTEPHDIPVQKIISA